MTPVPFVVVPRTDPSSLSSVAAVKAFLDRHYTSRVVMLDVARRAGMSHVRLIRAFRNEFGVPPLRYLIGLRIAHAVRLLERGMPPARVACVVGFCDQSHMIRHFRRVLGNTPGSYARVSHCRHPERSERPANSTGRGVDNPLSGR